MNKIILALTWALGFQAHAAEFLVKYRNMAGISAIQTLSQSRAPVLRVMEAHVPGQLVLVNVSEEKKAQAVTELLANPNVEYVVPNFKLHAFTETPVQVTKLKDQWAMSKVQAGKAWERIGNKGRKDVLVAVIDSGVDYKHQALAPNMVPGFDFAKEDEDPMDQPSMQNPGHGTHCAGVIGSTGLIEGGVVGLSPDVSIMPLRFLDENGSGDLNNAIKSIDYAIEKGVQVISASWGAEVPETSAAPLIEAVKRATDKGIIFVVASGNSSKNNDKASFWPANAPFDNVINVAASNPRDQKPRWSNYGKKNVHISAPGEDILSTLPGDKYGKLSGTSMATPLVAGMVALLKAQDPSLTGGQIKALLQTTGARNSVETACNCRIDAFNAVDHLMSKRPWVYPAAATLKENETLQLNTMNMNSSLTYTSSNPAVLTVDSNGVVTAITSGKAQVAVQDSSGAQASTLDLNVESVSSRPNECPFGNEKLCEFTCRVLPKVSWCKK